jgi:hypothetical protein
LHIVVEDHWRFLRRIVVVLAAGRLSWDRIKLSLWFLVKVHMLLVRQILVK